MSASSSSPTPEDPATTPAPAPREPIAPERIREIFDRNAQALAMRSGLGRGTGSTRARVVDGLFCEVTDGPWSIVVRQGRDAGGDPGLPNPGMIGRGALGSCLALSYMMWAAHRGVAVRSLEVEVQADYDSRGLYGVGDVRPGYAEVRYVVTVDSPAPRAELERLLDEADAHCPYLDVFARAQPMKREVRHAGAGARSPATGEPERG